MVTTIINALLFRSRAQKHIHINPELKKGYENFFNGWLFYGNMPWMIMMFGDISGVTETIFEYFTPKSMNPMVLAFHGSIVLLWMLSVRWIYFKDGAEFIEKHPAVINRPKTKITAQQVKQFFPLIIINGVIVMILLWAIDFS